MLGAAGAVAACFWYFSEEQRLRRHIKGVSRKMGQPVYDGDLVKVVGKVELIETLEAPLSYRPCAAWHVVVETTGKGSERIIDDHRATDFFVHEAGLKILIRASSSKVLLDKDATYRSGFLTGMSPELRSFLERYGQSSKTTILKLDRDLRYSEGAVEREERVSVVGVARWERDPERRAAGGDSYRSSKVPMRLVLEAPAGDRLLISDKPATTR